MFTPIRYAAFGLAALMVCAIELSERTRLAEVVSAFERPSASRDLSAVETALERHFREEGIASAQLRSLERRPLFEVPELTYPPIRSLRRGTPLGVLAREGEFVEVVLLSGERGWVLAEDTEPIDALVVVGSDSSSQRTLVYGQGGGLPGVEEPAEL